MTQTFTPNLNETNLKLEKVQFSGFIEPSKNVLDNILNFSKNLEIKHSKLVDVIEVIKS